MYVDLFLFLFVVVFGFAAFFFGVIYLVCNVLSGLGRGLFRVLGGGPRGVPPAGSIFGAKRTICPRRGCGHVEQRRARFCGQCGARLFGPEGDGRP
jgi:hypothetical protein